METSLTSVSDLFYLTSGDFTFNQKKENLSKALSGVKQTNPETEAFSLKQDFSLSWC
ncbi:hypothetical protein NEPTK9_001056 [Candidatus Neptunochlamydia vexilliferae]|uniref:Uncharacterized protein n=1 Tax=Candidatus Neptunichlamydia vexilliferae TaxID=1651774 RepID=A0ABS0B122_9BACT|nr:hypothetical protein [Candidatus Neptunochlamydia vexilliferae]